MAEISSTLKMPSALRRSISFSLELTSTAAKPGMAFTSKVLVALPPTSLLSKVAHWPEARVKVTHSPVSSS